MSTSPVVEDLPWGTTATGELDRSGVLAGSVLGTIAVFACFPLGVLGIVLSCRGLDRIRTDLPAARSLMRASWACFVAAPFTVLLLDVVISSFE